MGETDVIKKSKKRKGRKTISFDQETITKSIAEKLVTERTKQVARETIKEVTNKKQRNHNKKGNEGSNNAEVQQNNNLNIGGDTIKSKKKKKSGNQKNNNLDLKNNDDTEKSKQKEMAHVKISDETNNASVSENEGINPKRPKKPKRKMEKSDSLQVATQEELDPKKPEIKGEESIRAKKRRKYNELMKQKKLTQELDMQQKCLNYLSLWKHNRNEWKFEKLKQVWLKTHLYDDTRLPNEFWDTAVEYFNGSKGLVRTLVLKEALEILEKEEKNMEVDENGDEEDNESTQNDEENNDNVSKVKYSRARSIVQSLQE